jgi:DnaK suppressor protein
VLSETELLCQPAEAYMHEPQRDFFRTLLLAQRADLQQRIARDIECLRTVEPASDTADLGSIEEQQQWQLRLLGREKQLIDKFDQALARLARGEYGWCAQTGEAIGLQRLLLRPTAALCIEAKECQEQQEKHINTRGQLHG